MKKQSNSISYEQIRLNRSFADIDQLCIHCDISGVSSDAKLFYNHIFESGRIVKAKMREGMHGVCVYEACKKNNYGIKERDILNIFKEISYDVDYATLKKCSKILYEIIHFEIKKLKSIILFIREICDSRLESGIFNYFLMVISESRLCDAVIIHYATTDIVARK
jgi:hypothetical protein